ncbi:MAG: ion transporter [bacterium]|nr:ion transporter [bacterium]
MNPPQAQRKPWRRTLHTVIFGHDTRAGRAFDLVLIASILASVLVIMLDSVATVHDRWGSILVALEWAFTLLFTVEYVLRLLCAPRPLGYARSFYGVVDLVSIVPTYLSLVLPGAQFFQVVRALRILRVFRILKLAHYVGEADVLMAAIRGSRRKLSIFISFVLVTTIILGAAMYIVEGSSHGYTSIPQSIYWTIVTITTVGYGDISPATPLGKALASVIMLLGYAIVAVPTGIVTVELNRPRSPVRGPCPACALAGHDRDADFCKRCGTRL